MDPNSIFFIKTGFQGKIKVSALENIIRNYVSSISQIAHLGSLVFNKFLSRILETQNSLLSEIDFSSYQKCQNLLGYTFKILTEGSHKMSEDIPPLLKEIAQEFTSTFHIPKLQRIPNDSQIIKYMYKKYYVNFHTYLWYSFFGKQKRYFKQFLDLNNLDHKPWLYYLLFKVNNWKTKNNSDDYKIKIDKKMKLKANNKHVSAEQEEEDPLIPECILQFIQKQKLWLGISNVNNDLLEEITRINEKWLKSHPSSILQYWYNMLKEIEANNLITSTENAAKCKRSTKAQTCRVFTLAPLYSIKNHFIDIDNTVLKGLFSTLKKTKNLELEQEGKENDWNSMFDLKGLLTQNQLSKGFHFANHIQTDGSSICFMIKKSQSSLINATSNADRIVVEQESHQNTQKINNKRKRSLEAQIRSDYNIDNYNASDRVIAVDPGRTNIIYGIEHLEHSEKKEKFKKYKFTRKQFYQQSGADKAKKLTDAWIKQDQMEPIFTELSLCSLKTTNQENWTKYLTTFLQYKDVLWKHKSQLKYGRLKFRSYLLRNRCMDRVLSSWTNVTKEKDAQGRKISCKPIIAYGDGNFSSTGKGEKAIPNKTFYNKCKRYYKTVLVNEYRTTALCCGCHKRLKNIKHGRTSDGDLEKKKEETCNMSDEYEHKYDVITRSDEKIIEWDTYPLRGLKWCDSTKCKFKYVNRDQNASKNILDKYHWFAQGANSELPVAFTEPYKPDPRDERNFIRLVSVVEGSKIIRSFGHSAIV